MLQFHKKGKLIAALVGTAVILHLGNHLLKPFFVKKPETQEDTDQFKI